MREQKGTQVGRFETTDLPRGHRLANPPAAPHTSSQDMVRAQVNTLDHLTDAIAQVDATLASIDRLVRDYAP